MRKHKDQSLEVKILTVIAYICLAISLTGFGILLAVRFYLLITGRW